MTCTLGPTMFMIVAMAPTDSRFSHHCSPYDASVLLSGSSPGQWWSRAHTRTLLRERVETRARKSYLCPCLNGRAPGMILRPLGLSQVSHCRAYKLGDLTCFLPVASQSPNPGFLS